MEIHEILAQRRRQAERTQRRRLEALYQRYPALGALQEESVRLRRSLALAALSGSGADLTAIRRDIDRVEGERTALLERAGIDPNYKQIPYTCPDCQDTGFVNGQSCHCRNALLLDKLYEQSSIKDQLDRQNFDHFDWSLFRQDRQVGERESPYENMQRIVQDLKQTYIPHFGPKSPSLYFFGTVGTGKTFLALSLAKALLDRGHTVFYQTAYDLIEFLLAYDFDRLPNKEEATAKRAFIFSSDLLVIDDLGAEATNRRTLPSLFELINGRLIRQKPTVISSNLQPDELGEVYNDRIQSRIGHDYILYEVYGGDLRARQ